MYCSERCRDFDWKNGHNDSCFFLLLSYMDHNVPEESKVPFNSQLRGNKLLHSVNQRLYSFFGVENLKKVVQNNESMAENSDPRTKGFSGGKFNNATLEAFLSLEDNMDKLSQQEKDEHCWVIYFFITRTHKIKK